MIDLENAFNAEIPDDDDDESFPIKEPASMGNPKLQALGGPTQIDSQSF